MGEMLDNLEHLLGDFAGEADPAHGLPRTLKKLVAVQSVKVILSEFGGMCQKVAWMFVSVHGKRGRC